MPGRLTAVASATFAIILCSPGLAKASSWDSQTSSKCSKGGSAKGIEIRDSAPRTAGDLPFVQGTDKTTGATNRIYYARGLRGLAKSKATCWALELRLLAAFIPDDRRDVVWDALAFVTDERYAPDRSETADRRWIIVVGAAAKLSLDGFLVETMPHEQVHASQRRRGMRLPRWFEEGHAQWAGLKVTEAVAPITAALARSKASATPSSAVCRSLGAWGGTRVRPEAILRQLTPEDRHRYSIDPNFAPKGPFSFAPTDMITDGDDSECRYAASLNLFEGLEARHGEQAVKGWVTLVLASPTSDIEALAVERLGEDIRPMLR